MLILIIHDIRLSDLQFSELLQDVSSHTMNH